MAKYSRGRNQNPMCRSRFMGNAKAQIPLRITPEFIQAAAYRLENIDANSGYQAQSKYEAAGRWIHAARHNEYVWLGVSGAATPVGIGGLIADMISRGLVDAIVSTGANAYHDLHFAFGLPVRHGHHQVDDNVLSDDKTTRIYTQYIHNDMTLKAQDMINQQFGRRVFERLTPPFSTAQLLYEFGREMLNDTSGMVVDKKGSFIARAAEYCVPVFLDSGSNHSFGMDFTPLHLEGLHVDTSPSQDVIEAAALSIYTQPQLNIFLGEAGPRNFTQTTAPTASEIFYVPFEGSAGCIMFTTADARTGGLSGSTQAEAVTWGKYPDADAAREVIVWGEYTLTAPDVMAYVAGKTEKNNIQPRRLMEKKDDIVAEFLEKVKECAPKRKRAQAKLRRDLPYVVEGEVEARKAAGYRFD